MMGKMVKNMTYFVVLLIVVLLSFGVTRQAILNPNAEPKFRIIRDVCILYKYHIFIYYIYIYIFRVRFSCIEKKKKVFHNFHNARKIKKVNSKRRRR